MKMPVRPGTSTSANVGFDETGRTAADGEAIEVFLTRSADVGSAVWTCISCRNGCGAEVWAPAPALRTAKMPKNNQTVLFLKVLYIGFYLVKAAA